MLWMMPLLSALEMAAVTGLSESSCRRRFTELHSRGLITGSRLGRTLNIQQRWWLTTIGVQVVADEFGFQIAWQVAEVGLKWLIRRLPMVESYYRVAPTLWAHPAVLPVNPIYSYHDPDFPPIAFPSDLRLVGFTWLRESAISAMAVYEGDAWVPFTWAGLTTTWHEMGRTTDLWLEALEVPVGSGNEVFDPAAWVVIAYDRLSASHVMEFWPFPGTMVATADGRMATSMKPGAFTVPLQDHSKPASLGRPERVKSWVENHPVMTALNGQPGFAVAMAVAEWYSITNEQLEQQVGESGGKLNAAVNLLIDAKVIVRIDGAFYLGDRGMLALAHMDRISAKTVHSTLDAFLHEDGRYREHHRNHDQAVITVVQKLTREHWEDMDVIGFAGWRGLRNYPGLTQIRPDALVCLVRENTMPSFFYLELELAAGNPAQVERRLAPYRLMQQNGAISPPLLMVCADAQVEKLYWRLGKGLPMLTTTLNDILSSASAGPDSAWRHDGKPVDLLYLELLRLLQERDAES